MTAGFWNGKRVLVTGHTGFKGAWLTLWLSSMQAEVTGYALATPTQPSFFDLADVAASCRSLHGDVRDLDHLSRTVREGRFDAIFHLAAQALVRPSYRDPIETYSTNVLGTANVLEAVRQSGGCPAVVIVTSDKCYENREQPAGYVETDPMGGHDPYSSSKGCAELVTAAFRRSYFAEGPTAVASARAGNVIGGGDWAQDRLLPDCVRAFAEGRAVAIRNPQATRPWQHVLEPLGGYLLLAERLTEDGRAFAEAWNFGPDEKDVCPVWRVAQRFAELWGPPARCERDAGRHPHEAVWLGLNCRKARERLNWRPRTDIDQALTWTAQWYRDVLGGADGRAMALRQIEQFMEGSA